MKTVGRMEGVANDGLRKVLKQRSQVVHLLKVFQKKQALVNGSDHL